MGADFIYEIMPSVRITESRQNKLIKLLSSLTEEEFKQIDIYEDYEGKDFLHFLMNQLSFLIDIQNGNTREVSHLRFPEMVNTYLITGGMDYGGEPTKAFNVFEIFNQIEVIYNQLLAWSKEDHARRKKLEDKQ